jgi:hypothetical protein
MDTFVVVFSLWARKTPAGTLRCAAIRGLIGQIHWLAPDKCRSWLAIRRYLGISGVVNSGGHPVNRQHRE